VAEAASQVQAAGTIGEVDPMVRDMVRSRYEALKSDLDKLRGDLSNLMEGVVHSSRDSAVRAKEGTVAAARRGWGQVTSSVGAVRERGREAVEGVERQVARRPFVCLATVFGIGLILGALIRLRR
jgi:ElaB/YqjD/DUF883 family membrane-anchored ribosome-binding protein